MHRNSKSAGLEHTADRPFRVLIIPSLTSMFWQSGEYENESILSSMPCIKPFICPNGIFSVFIAIVCSYIHGVFAPITVCVCPISSVINALSRSYMFIHMDAIAV